MARQPYLERPDTLGNCAPGVCSRIVCVAGEPLVVRRLAEIGVRTGAQVTTLGKFPGGGRVIAINDARLAVDRRTADAITVTPL